MVNKRNQLGVVGLTLLMAACGDASKTLTTNNDTTQKPAAQTQGAVQQKQMIQSQLSGKDPGHVGRVISVNNAGGYSYVEVENQVGRFWIACSTVNVTTGELVRWGDFAVMKQFKSKALDKTFDEILFVSRVTPYQVEAEVNEGKVLSVTVSGGYNYIEAETAKGIVWVAAPVAPLSDGDNVSWSGATEMKNFFSKTLKKNFKSILFVGDVNIVSGG